MIEDHAWRPPTGCRAHLTPYAERPCFYLNCGRPLAEHARPATGARCPCPVLDLEPYDVLCTCGHGAGRHIDGAGACAAVGS